MSFFLETDLVGSSHINSHEEHGRIKSAEEARAFMLGGNATFTLRSNRTQTRFTYRIRKPQNDDGQFYFVSLLNGADNESFYAYFGYIRRGVFFYGNAKAKVGVEAPSVKGFDWAWRNLTKGELPESLDIWHEGRCGRCNRKLTVPSSIASGFGPECAERI